MKQWIKTKLAEDEYLPTYTATFFIVIILLDMLDKNIALVAGFGFNAVILMLVKIIDRLNDIRALLLFILKEQDGAMLIIERKEDAKGLLNVKISAKKTEDNEAKEQAGDE